MIWELVYFRYVELLPKIKEKLNKELAGYLDSIIINQDEQANNRFKYFLVKENYILRIKPMQ